MSIQSGVNSLISQAVGIAAIGSKGKQPKVSDSPVPKRTIEPEKVMMDMAKKGDAKVKQRRKFADYMQNVKTNLGTFKDLSPNIQKTIMASYSKAERKKIMDTADKEKLNGSKTS